MKVCLFARVLPQDGATIHLYSVASALVERGHEVHIFSSGPRKEKAAIELFKEIQDKGVKHHKILFPNKKSISKFGTFIQLLHYIIATPQALAILLRIKPDVIHVHYPVTSYIANFYKKLTGKKYIMTYHAANIPRHPLHINSDYVIAISNLMLHQLTEIHKYRPEQIEFIHLGVADRFDNKPSKDKKVQLKEKNGINNGKTIVGFVGTLLKAKGLEDLFKSCQGYRDTVHLVFLGDGDILCMDSLIKKYDMKDNVSVFGFQDPIEFYSMYDIFVLPSYSEGFGTVAAEAMMMGLPVIRTNTGGADEQIDHGENGFIYTARDVDALKKYINLLVTDEELNANISIKAQRKAIEIFGEDTMIDRILEVYKKCI